MALSFTTPVGRLVYGSVWDGSDRAKDGSQRITKSGPNVGKPLTTWSFGVAFPKSIQLQTGQVVPNTEFNTFYAQIHELARQAWPQYMNGPVDPITGKPGPSHPRFAMKIADGDGMDGDGKPNNQKEGWAGHWVVKFSSSFGAPRVFDINVGLDPAQQLQDKSRVLPGDYVAVQGSADKNTGDTPGLYMNGNMVCFVGGGVRIVTGPRASEAFGNINMGSLPPGCVPGANPATVGAIAAAAPQIPAALPVAPAVPAVPAAPAVAHDPAAKATADGWIVHPQAPGHRYKGQEVKTDAEVFAMYPAPAAALPVAPAVPAVPAAPIVPNHQFVQQAAGVPAVSVVPVAAVITLSPAALAAGYTLQAFEQAGYDYARMKAEGWAL